MFLNGIDDGHDVVDVMDMVEGCGRWAGPKTPPDKMLTGGKLQQGRVLIAASSTGHATRATLQGEHATGGPHGPPRAPLPTTFIFQGLTGLTTLKEGDERAPIKT